MARRHPILRALAIVIGVVVILMAGGLILRLGDEGLSERLSLGRRVGVLEIRGVIQDTSDAIEVLERFRKRESTVAVVVRIESPGGAVAPAQELYDEIWRVREEKPVIASFGNVAASAAYYVASAANQIVAAPGTLTGSIGAIMSLPQAAPLAEKVGVSEEIVKSGPFKDIGHPLRALAAEERALLQEMVDDVLRQFVEAVARGRGMEPARVRALADGRIYSGAQAHAAGLVDHLGGLEVATRLAWEQAGEQGEPQVMRVRGRRTLPWWVRFLGEAALGEPISSGGLHFIYRGPIPG
jgi:protease-4